ncbi:MAG: tRNA epoxyqueuosine(34) reductase QueG [Hellea sp.]|nr:tRNA epoxyqueuosine(34) reductase QueG [Hellea sp.]
MFSLTKTILDRCDELNFTKPYVVNLETYGQKPAEDLRKYIDKKYHGTMSWMQETETRRNHPNNLWPDASSAIVMGLNYGPYVDPLISLKDREKATISVYARNQDYHKIIKGRLKEIGGLIARDTGKDIKVFVDTAPLMEKPLAAAAGLGWQGKHTNLVNREYGSWLFLGVILSAAKIEASDAEINHCGTCNKCINICPTDAFPEPYKIDARKCISYLTIEHKGPVEVNLRSKMGNRIYGCDDCLAICPWNKFAQTAAEIKVKAKEDLNNPDLSELATLSDLEFRQYFANSPIKRIGRNQFVRNVLYAIGNSENMDLIKAVEKHLESDVFIIKDAAEWAYLQLTSTQVKLK